MHVVLSPRTTGDRSTSCAGSQVGTRRLDDVEVDCRSWKTVVVKAGKNLYGRKTRKRAARSGTKSGVRVQSRNAAACWQGCKATLITDSKNMKVAGRKSVFASQMEAGAHPARDPRQARGE
jgi:hypothetical protein